MTLICSLNFSKKRINQIWCEIIEITNNLYYSRLSRLGIRWSGRDIAFSTNTRRSVNGVLMLFQCRRQWPNIKETLGCCVFCAQSDCKLPGTSAKMDVFRSGSRIVGTLLSEKAGLSGTTKSIPLIRLSCYKPSCHPKSSSSNCLLHQKSVTQCWFNIGPSSTTLGRY